MRLNREEAKKLLLKERGVLKDDNWIEHSLCVGNCAYVIACALKEKGIEVDCDKAAALGYIHDIGKRSNKWGSVFPHIINGYNYIKSLGYDEEYAGICLKHSFLNNDINCLSNESDETDKTNPNYDFVKEYISSEYTIEEKIINLCDLMCTNKVLSVEKRMIDLLLRHGVFRYSHYHIEETMKLKDYFDKLLGYNLYELFPEIKENL